ncbi:MAG: ActS/PrrB/RegB family redox-sensitive histidine kinase [Rhodobacteraceae bacterium]|nr:ActS/PrrB/RegB family redox-sensitive histidine kinase [Paracoccaceae bacterium]
MSMNYASIYAQSARSGLVRLRTLIILRWLAVIGQVTAILISKFIIGLQIDLKLCILAIVASVLINLLATFIFPENRRLPERDFLAMLLFDLIQLAVLLYLTGGLNNPFSILILAPVTVSAMTLRPFSTFFISGLAIILVSVLAFDHVPLIMQSGIVIKLPFLFTVGFWTALMIGIVFLAFYARRVTSETHLMSQALLATQMALSREQKLTDLGGVVAAAAHELGTPLATINLASTELIEDLKNNKELREDAELIREQVQRCKVILDSMGRSGKDDLQIKIVPITNLIEEAAEPHSKRNKVINITHTFQKNKSESIPNIHRQPEIIHGLRNLIQNAVDFAKTEIWIDTTWNERTISVQICDDGDGYPAEIFGRIGDPFIKRRDTFISKDSHPEYEGMGLGLFIAKTLLERSGAQISFSNGSDLKYKKKHNDQLKGAIAEVTWIRSIIEDPNQNKMIGLGENQQFEI